MTGTSIKDLPGCTKLIAALDNEIRELDPTHTSRQQITGYSGAETNQRDHAGPFNYWCDSFCFHDQPRARSDATLIAT
jgi:hypothetical protein